MQAFEFNRHKQSWPEYVPRIQLQVAFIISLTDERSTFCQDIVTRCLQSWPCKSEWLMTRQYLSRPGVRRQPGHVSPLGSQPPPPSLSLSLSLVTVGRNVSSAHTNNNLLSADTREKNWKGGTIKLHNCQSALVVKCIGVNSFICTGQ